MVEAFNIFFYYEGIQNSLWYSAVVTTSFLEQEQGPLSGACYISIMDISETIFIYLVNCIYESPIGVLMLAIVGIFLLGILP